nr:MAG TPA: hypothetical protein [Caudoviricetes sp.]
MYSYKRIVVERSSFFIKKKLRCGLSNLNFFYYT